MKKRYLAIPAVIVLILMSFPFASYIAPVRPFIQLPGECYPGTIGMFGNSVLSPNCWTNTFTSSLVAWLIVLIIGFSLRARSRTADEVPTGFYNFFEMVVEGAFGFVENISGTKKARDFFPYFMTYILIILVSNWMGLVPGVDSIGLWEHKPFFEEEKRVLELEAEGVSHKEALEIVHEEHLFDEVDKKNKGDLRDGQYLLIRSTNTDENAAVQTMDHLPGAHGEAAELEGKWGRNPEAADWTIVPFFRPAATDLNMTLAFALIAMVMVYYFGFKYLGARAYLAKFFPFIGKGFGAEVAANPIRVIDVAVGLLEFVGDISKIISFAFRLLGNIFAGMVLLFVMAFLLPAANIVFYGLEFFVGLIQALVFALLMVIFMNGATEAHGHGDDHH
ncbi:MAG: F0F1 ATP synthase subunit A [Anaerolineae bacterium]